MNNQKILLVDASNMLYRTFFANKDHDDQISAGLAHHTALKTLNKYFKEHQPHAVVLAFDRQNWRKVYTNDEQVCHSTKKYKGNRRQKMTPSEQEKFQRFLEHISEFEQIVREHTSIICLSDDGLEADDLIAGVVQLLPESEHIVLSSDKDLIQLLRNENVTLIDPSRDKQRTLDDWEGDADFFMYEKCLRGDNGDNVQSAFPRVRKTRIRKAYSDPYEHTNMMQSTWTDHEGREFKVGDLYEENKMLMDLTYQPQCVRNKIFDEVEREFADPGEFSYFHFLKFCGKYEMKEISKHLEHFIPMLSR